MEVKRLSKINYKRKVFRDFLQWIRCKHLPADRDNWNVDSGHVTDLTCPGSGCVYEHGSLDHALRCLHSLDLISANPDSCYLCARKGFDAQLLGRADISGDHTVWVNNPVLLIERSCQGVFELHQRQARTDFISTEQLSLDAKPVLQFNVVFEGGRIFFISSNQQISTLAIVYVLPDFILEALDHWQTFKRESHINLGRELITDSSGAASCGTRAEKLLFFEQHDIFHSTLCEMVGRAGPHHATPDDYNVCCCWCVHFSIPFISTSPTGFDFHSTLRLA